MGRSSKRYFFVFCGILLPVLAMLASATRSAYQEVREQRSPIARAGARHPFQGAPEREQVSPTDPQPLPPAEP